MKKVLIIAFIAVWAFCITGNISANDASPPVKKMNVFENQNPVNRMVASNAIVIDQTECLLENYDGAVSNIQRIDATPFASVNAAGSTANTELSNLTNQNGIHPSIIAGTRGPSSTPPGIAYGSSDFSVIAITPSARHGNLTWAAMYIHRMTMAELTMNIKTTVEPG